MSKNWRAGRVDTGMTLALVVDSDAKAGDVTHAGGAAGAGLYGYLLMDPNSDNVASVRLLPTEGVVELPVTGTLTAGNAVYSQVTGGAVAYNTNGTASRYHIGHIVDLPGRTPAAGNAFVYLGTATAEDGS